MVKPIQFLKMHSLVLNIVIAPGKAYLFDAFQYCQILIKHHTHTEPNRNENTILQCKRLPFAIPPPQWLQRKLLADMVLQAVWLDY